MYTSPSITELGSLRSMTQFTINKVGVGPDVLTGIPTPAGIVGNGSQLSFGR